jgi:hypothetical protein
VADIMQFDQYLSNCELGCEVNIATSYGPHIWVSIRGCDYNFPFGTTEFNGCKTHPASDPIVNGAK